MEALVQQTPPGTATPGTADSTPDNDNNDNVGKNGESPPSPTSVTFPLQKERDIPRFRTSVTRGRGAGQGWAIIIVQPLADSAGVTDTQIIACSASQPCPHPHPAAVKRRVDVGGRNIFGCTTSGTLPSSLSRLVAQPLLPAVAFTSRRQAGWGWGGGEGVEEKGWQVWNF
ncbi:hypothetical protein C0Q70_21724 [Pomacea canaliculata]|uniref:Uncharacterized protein n=1 Tax=Pomacea canaliculata TaxID=400727 RepID=A0A2T7NDA8_POMCA|nr:hypothetical protein C0Q70_21724 [Pomacea canaliculata]